MNISSATPPLTPEARSFLETLEFRVKSERNASILSIGIEGDARDFVPVELRPNNIYKEWNLHHYGIMDRPYRDLDGKVKMPRPSIRGEGMEHELSQCFAVMAGRPMTDDEDRAIRAHIADQANRSPIVNSWAEGIDFVALHAIPFDYRFVRGDYSQYEWLAGPGVDAQAMKRFIVEHPLLAGVATSGGYLFEVAEEQASPEAGYEAVVNFIVEKGFPYLSPLDDKENTSPVPRAILDRLKGVPAPRHVLGEDSIMEMVSFLRLAACLDPESIPRTQRGIDQMVKASQVMGYLNEELESADAAAEEGYGFSLTFTDEEIRAIFRDVDFTKLDVKFSDGPYELGAPLLGKYGAILAGREDWVRSYMTGTDDADELEIDFSALKEALIRDGYVATAQKAKEAVAGAAEAKTFAP